MKRVDFSIYVCPKCKGALVLIDQALSCQICQITYPIIEGIPDFILEDLTQSANPVLRSIADWDWLARIYETKLWYPLVIKLYGGLSVPSFQELMRIATGMVKLDKGIVLDAACGPGTLGRRLASQTRVVYGVDISMGMLRRGVGYIERDHIVNVHFARAKVEALPFQDALFDAALCGGALHLFADTVAALREIGRTMKEGAQIVVTTFIAGNEGLFQFRRIREYYRQRGVRVFEIPELEWCLVESGFEKFQPQVHGSGLLFSARKTRA